MFRIARRCGACIITVLTAVLLLSVNPGEVGAEEIRVFSGGAPQRALRGMTPDFENATGHRVHFTFALVTAIQKKLADGERADLVLLPVQLIAATEKSIPMQAEGRGILARVGLGVITRDGAPLPDISTSDAVRKMLLDARSIAMPEPSTPGGGHLARMVAELGIADNVKPKLIIKAAIDGGPDLVGRGEADIGFYLLSEVQSAKGITIVGLLPSSLQNLVTYGTAIPAYNSSPSAALAFVKYVSDVSRSEKWKAAGFDLAATGK